MRSLCSFACALAVAGCAAVSAQDIAITAEIPVRPGAAASELAARLPVALPVRAADFSFVVETSTSLALVVSQHAEAASLAGSPRLVTRLDAPVLEARDALAAGASSSDFEALRDATVTLYDGPRVRCTARVRGFTGLGRTHQPVDRWNEHPVTHASPESVGREVWDLSSQWIVAELSAGPACKGATWGRLASLPPPVFPAVAPADAARVERLRRAFRALPAWASIQQDFRGDHATSDLAHGDASWDGAGPGVVVVSPPGQRPLAFATASVGESCAFSAGLRGVWSIDAGEREALVGASTMARDVVLFADLNGDGYLEALVDEDFRGGRSLFTLSRAEFLPVFEVSVPVHGCPC